MLDRGGVQYEPTGTAHSIGELGQRKNKDRGRSEAREKYAAAHRLVERCAAAIAVIILSVFLTPAVPSA